MDSDIDLNHTFGVGMDQRDATPIEYRHENESENEAQADTIAALEGVGLGLGANNDTKATYTSLFSALEEEYFNRTNDISAALAEIPETFGEQRRALVSDSLSNMKEAGSLLDRMNRQSLQLPFQSQHSAIQRISLYTRDLEKLKKEVGAATRGISESGSSVSIGKIVVNSSTLTPISSAATTAPASASSMRIHNNNSRLSDGRGQGQFNGDNRNESIRDSLQVVHDSSSLGIDILQTLSDQKHQISNAKDGLTVADDNVNRSNRVLRSMERRVNTDNVVKAMVVFAIVVLMIVIIVLAVGKS